MLFKNIIFGWSQAICTSRIQLVSRWWIDNLSLQVPVWGSGGNPPAAGGLGLTNRSIVMVSLASEYVTVTVTVTVSLRVCVCVYYCSTHYKVVRVGGGG
jgi:hypothetical protein